MGWDGIDKGTTWKIVARREMEVYGVRFQPCLGPEIIIVLQPRPGAAASASDGTFGF